MTSIFFYLVFLNSLSCFSASFDPSLGVADYNGGEAMRDMGDFLSGEKVNGTQLGGNVKHFPFHAIVAINRQSGTSDIFCSGTIISKSILITSAYCICEPNVPLCKQFDKSQIHIYVGSTTSNDLLKNTKIHKVDYIRIHDFFLNTIFTRWGLNAHSIRPNIALLKIEGSFDFNKYVKAINLPDSSVANDVPNMPMECTVYGFQAHDPFNSQALKPKYVRLQFQEAKYSLISNMACKSAWYRQHAYVRPEFNVCFRPTVPTLQPLCLNGKSDGLGSAGLACRNTSGKYIMGIVAMIPYCKPKIAVFTRIDTSLGFIKKFMEDEKDTKSSGDLIHNQVFTQFYGALLTSVSLLTLLSKNGF